MWTKYDYVCSDCDALIEITTLDNLRDSDDPTCPCGSNNTINISVRDATLPVINITPNKVVKINSNPYN